jgi:polyhydroxybutyrate depolymerase
LPPVIGVEAWAAQWARRNGCDGGPSQQSAIGTVEPLFWQGCVAPVELYRITRGGHTWPGGFQDDPAMTTHDISANDVIWDFFTRFALGGS